MYFGRYAMVPTYLGPFKPYKGTRTKRTKHQMTKGQNTKNRIKTHKKLQKVENDKRMVENDKIYTVEWIPVLPVYWFPRNNIILG